MTGETSGMTDIETWRAFLGRFGIGFTESTGPDGTSLTMQKGDSKVTGYPLFVVQIDFAPDGSFREIGAWE